MADETSTSSGPRDALEEGQVSTKAADGAQVKVNVRGRAAAVGTPGPEDAMDPTADNLGDYADRIEDAHHYTHQPIDRPTLDGPQSAPVAQNERAQKALDGTPLTQPAENPQGVAEDPATDSGQDNPLGAGDQA